MKFKSLLQLALFFIAINTYTQENVDLSEKISKSYVENGNYIILSPKDSEEVENLKFIEFVKLDKSKFDFAKIIIPKIVIVDSKQGDDLKKNQKRIEFLNKNSIGKGMQGFNLKYFFTYGSTEESKSMQGLELSKLKFDFNNSDIILLGGESSLDDISTKDNKFKQYYFEDKVIAKFQGNKSNKFYYLIDFGFYGIIDENEYNKSISERKIVYNKAKEKILNIETAKFREVSKKWFDGYFSNLFPDNEIHLYDVVYDINIEGSGEKAKLITTAISNTKETNLNLKDFYSTENHRPIEFKYKSSLNIYKLLLNPIVIDSIIGTKKLKIDDFRNWDQNNQDVRINDEAKSLRKDINNFTKFNSNYFINKFRDLSYFKNIEKKPYILKLQKNNNVSVIGFEFNQYVQQTDYNINHGMNLSIETSGTNVKFNFTPQKTGNYSQYFDKYNFNPESITREFDTRLDSLNFKFVFVDPLLLMSIDFDREYYRYQKDVYNLIDFDAKNCSNTLKEYYDYIQVNKKEKLTENKNKEILYSKFGIKYTNEALNGNIVVGMPEGLLPIPLKLWKITSRTKWKSGYRIYCTSYLDSSAKLSVYVENGKVSLVSY